MGLMRNGANPPARRKGAAAPVRVPIRAVVVRDDDGGRRARVTPSQFVQWVEFANQAFREAGIQFAFDPSADIDEIRCSALNDAMGASDGNWPDVKALGNEIAARNPGRLVVLVRHGPGAAGTGAAFAGVDHDFVVMGGFDDMIHCGHPHVDALAHEIGHYLGLPHTFVGDPFLDVAEAEAHLAAQAGDPRAFDGDGFTDTPPDPAIRAFECERRQSVEIGGRSFVLPRRNLMSYYDERDSLTPQQIARARWVLERRRRYAMRLPSNRPGSVAFEAESLAVVEAVACSPSVQPMHRYGAGGWSGDAQLFCGAERGGRLTLELPLAEPVADRISLYATLAPDFGVVQCALNGRPCGPPLDLHAPLVLPTGALSLGPVSLPAGTHRIAFEVLGKAADSGGHCFGIDAIAVGIATGVRS